MLCPTCSRGSFQTLRHNNIRILTALSTEVSSNVAVEPFLQQVSEEESVGASINRDEDAQIDVTTGGFKSIWFFQQTIITSCIMHL